MFPPTVIYCTKEEISRRHSVFTKLTFSPRRLKYDHIQMLVLH